MAGNFQKGTSQRLSSRSLESRVGAALLLLIFHRADEALGDIALGRSTNAGFLFLRRKLKLLLKLL